MNPLAVPTRWFPDTRKPILGNTYPAEEKGEFHSETTEKREIAWETSRNYDPSPLEPNAYLGWIVHFRNRRGIRRANICDSNKLYAIPMSS